LVIVRTQGDSQPTWC